MGAKVPIVKVIDTGTGVECDLSVENRDGISKSLIIRFITSIDQRFQKLSFLVSLRLLLLLRSKL
ncbi:putative Nucleotidyltransferase superfamily [Helianthus debilis subsp. tardiflorus]